jgi:hypothetical protein
MFTTEILDIPLKHHIQKICVLIHAFILMHIYSIGYIL